MSQVQVLSRAFISYFFLIVNFKNGKYDVWLDGHNNLVTPDPVPNSEVKLVMFAFVLSLMGRRKAVCFISKNFILKFLWCFNFDLVKLKKSEPLTVTPQMVWYMKGFARVCSASSKQNYNTFGAVDGLEIWFKNYLR